MYDSICTNEHGLFSVFLTSVDFFPAPSPRGILFWRCKTVVNSSSSFAACWLEKETCLQMEQHLGHEVLPHLHQPLFLKHLPTNLLVPNS